MHPDAAASSRAITSSASRGPPVIAGSRRPVEARPRSYARERLELRAHGLATGRATPQSLDRVDELPQHEARVAQQGMIDRIVLVEYRLSNRVSVVGFRNDRGELGFDVRVRKRF